MSWRRRSSLRRPEKLKDDPFNALLNSFAKAHKGGGRTKWVNSPNVYQKVEVLETGTPDPKKITKVEVIKFETA